MIEGRKEFKADPGSFRDPSSRVYVSREEVVREIEPGYMPDYDLLMRSGLYEELVGREMLIPHQELARNASCIVVRPERVPFVTYPYEWSFAMLQEAAVLTLQVNRAAMKHGMILKDASAYNVQWHRDRMKFIDTCSFMKYDGSSPWGAYSQFLRHFACPMLLLKYRNPPDLKKFSQVRLDGIPVPLTANMMPFSTRFNMGMWAHIFSQSMNFIKVNPRARVKMSGLALGVLLDNLEHFIATMEYKAPFAGWIRYAEAGSYTSDSLDHKKQIVREFIGETPGKNFLDLGSNTGMYSMMAADAGRDVVAIDSDHDCVQHLYDKTGILPLVVDICNPSPGIGWANKERASFLDRLGEVDCIMALALVHHLCVKNNVPLGMVADLLAEHARSLIIEWVPPEDPKAKELLGSKKIPLYCKEEFKAQFGRKFNTVDERNIRGSGRSIFRMERR